MDEFRDVPGWPGVRASRGGEVQTCRARGPSGTLTTKWRSLGIFWGGSGYLSVKLYVNGVRKEIAVHHLVLLAFVGPRPEGSLGRHLNDIRSDNRAENLAWGTHQENMADAVRNARSQQGERHWNAQLSKDAIREIRCLNAERKGLGLTQHDIGRMFGITNKQVSAICSGFRWSHVG